MPTIRSSSTIFSTERSQYAGATITFYALTGTPPVKDTATKITLYDSVTGATTLSNPQILDSRGKYAQDVYYEDAHIISVTGLVDMADHDTGIVHIEGKWRGDWVTATAYLGGEVIRDSSTANDTGNIYVCTAAHTSGTFETDLTTNVYWDEAINIQDIIFFEQQAQGSMAVAMNSEAVAKAKAVLTAADAVSTAADAVSTAADVVLTGADVVTTGNLKSWIETMLAMAVEASEQAWTAAAAAAASAFDLVSDLTPQLGAALDGQDNTVSEINLKDYGEITNAIDRKSVV